jgi:VanZ family protein
MEYTKKRKIYIAISAILLVAVMVTIFLLSAENGEKSSNTSGTFVKIHTFILGFTPPEDVVRTLGHFCEFAALGFLSANMLFAYKNKLKPVLTALLSSGYAVTDEIHQIFVPERACQLSDLAVDFGGIILGTIVFSAIYIIIRKLEVHKNESN